MWRQRLLGLELAPPRTSGYDAIRRSPNGPERIQIKGRAYGEDAKPGQRLGTIKQGAACDTVLLVLLDNGTLERDIGRMIGAGRCGQVEVGRQESRAKLRDQLLHRIAFVTPGLAPEIPVKARYTVRSRRAPA